MTYNHTDYARAMKSYSAWRCRGEGRAYIAILFSMNEGKCPICGKNMILYFGSDKKNGSEHNRATLDHITPITFTRKHDKNNLQLCCYQCNQDKGCEDKAYSHGKGNV